MILNVCSSIGSTRDSFILIRTTVSFEVYDATIHIEQGEATVTWNEAPRVGHFQTYAGRFLSFAFACVLLVDERFHFWKIGYWFRLYMSQVPYIIDTLEAERIAVFHAWRLQLWGLITETRAWHIAVEFEWSEAFGCLVLLSSIFADCQVNHVAKSATTATASSSAQSGFRVEHVLTWKVWHWRSEGSLRIASKYYSLAIHRSSEHWNVHSNMYTVVRKKCESFDDVRLFIWLHTAHQRPFQFSSTLASTNVASTNQNEEMEMDTNQVMLSNRIKELLEHMKDVKERCKLQRCNFARIRVHKSVELQLW